MNSKSDRIQYDITTQLKGNNNKLVHMQVIIGGEHDQADMTFGGITIHCTIAALTACTD